MNLKQLLFLKAAGGGEQPVEKTVTGNPATFVTDVKRNLTGLTVAFNDNSGITGLTVYRSGKNMFDKSKGIKTTSTMVRFARNMGEGDAFLLKAGITYCISVKASSTPGEISLIEPFTSNRYVTERNTDNIVYTPDADIQIGASAYWAGGRPEDADDFQIEVSGTKTDFEAYTGTSTAVAFGETVNEGTLNVLTGELTVTAPTGKTIQLEPVAIETLIGTNNVWTSTDGTNTVKYLSKN